MFAQKTIFNTAPFPGIPFSAFDSRKVPTRNTLWYHCVPNRNDGQETLFLWARRCLKLVIISSFHTQWAIASSLSSVLAILGRFNNIDKSALRNQQLKRNQFYWLYGCEYINIECWRGRFRGRVAHRAEVFKDIRNITYPWLWPRWGRSIFAFRGGLELVHDLKICISFNWCIRSVLSFVHTSLWTWFSL